MNTSTSPVTNSPTGAGRSSFVRWLLIILAVVTFFYLLLCTYLWNIVFGLFLVLVTGNASVAEAAKSPWCKAGDWVLDTFQPMVSDQQMIDHLLKNKEAMTRIAEMAARRRSVDKDGQTAEFTSLVKSVGMLSIMSNYQWGETPYSLENARASRVCWAKINTLSSQEERLDCWRKDVALGRVIYQVSLTPLFGKTSSQYFCTTQRNSFKDYKYYPAEGPLIQDGYLMNPLFDYQSDGNYTSARGSRLVNSLDFNLGDQDVKRQIDQHWFISRN